MGVAALVLKPVSLHELATTVRAALDKGAL
jgi:hypothetical protein